MAGRRSYASAQTPTASTVTTTWSNHSAAATSSSSISTTTYAPVTLNSTTFCGHCFVNAEAQANFWWPEILTDVVATLFVTVIAINGTNHTTTTLVENTSTFSNPLPTSVSDVYLPINETTLAIPPYTLTWPNTYVFVANTLTVTWGVSTIVSGTPACSATTFTTSANVPNDPGAGTDGDEILLVNPAGFNGKPFGTTDAEIPADILAFAGLPSWCDSDGNGIPFANVPVLSLTATSTIVQGDFSSPRPTSPSPAGFTSSPPLPFSPLTATENSPVSSLLSGPPSLSSIPGSLPASLTSSSIREFTQLTPTANSPVSSLLSNAPSAANFPQSSPPGLPVMVPSRSEIPAPFSVLPSTSRPDSSEVNVPSLSPGGPPVTISGTVISLAPSNSALIVGTTTFTPNGITPAPKPIVSEVTLNAQSNLVIGSQTIIPGGPAATISGTIVSLAPAATALILGSSTINLTPIATLPENPLAMITVGGSVITANSNAAFVLGSRTLLPGGPAVTIAGTPISLAPSASLVIIGSSTIPLPPAISANPKIINFAGQPITANSASIFVIGSQTLFPGGPALTISGTPISLAASATAVIIGSSTIPLLPLSPASPLVITFEGQTITANSASDFIIGTQTLVPGGPGIVVSGTPISLAPSATAVVIGTSTFPLSPSSPSSEPLVFTFAGQTVTANSASDFVIGTQTLVPGGPAITVSGTPISLAVAGTDVVVGSVTEGVGRATSTGGGLGGVIMSGIGGTGFTGDGMEVRVKWWWVPGLIAWWVGLLVW
ncbi:hypothetical protein MMC06_002435 [Schaereria dolodes]|nr:hypothetical protein [Schaereria dolodes]